MLGTKTTIAFATIGTAGFFMGSYFYGCSKKAYQPINVPLHLHVYDHCPYCVRVEIFLKHKNIPYKRTVWGYGDKDGLVEKFGKKQLPVLQYGDKIQKESLDIIKLLDEFNGVKDSCVAPKTDRKDLQDWQARLKPLQRILCRPRLLKLPVFDYSKQEDIDYAKAKYEGTGFNYEEAEAASAETIPQVEKLLEEFADLLATDKHLNNWGFSYDDIIYLPELRTLSCVDGLNWPSAVLNYMQTHCAGAEFMDYYANRV